MPFAGIARSDTFSNTNYGSNGDDAVAMAIGSVLVAPFAGAMKGWERRTLNSMENAVTAQLTSDEQRQTFKAMYLNQKMDTKPYTTATGPLSVLAVAGGVIALSNPVGLVLVGVGVAGNFGALLVAERSQKFNRDRYEKALQAINLAKGVNKEVQINGDAGLSDFQKMFGIGGGIN
jgi:hypothetical protein